MYKHVIYFLIGCPRTGSTYLHNVLKQNHRINLLPKENHFFMKKNLIKRRYYYKKPNYHQKTPISHYIEKLDINKINYDINTLYFYDLDSLKTIKKIFPKSIFICFLRDPVKRHLSMSLNNIKKYYYYKGTGDFKFPISDFYDLKKSWVFKDEMLNLSNYDHYKKILKKNKINCKYYNSEHLFKNKKNYIKFLNDIKIKTFNSKLNYSKHSQKEYLIKLNNSSYFEKIKTLIFKKFYQKKVEDTVLQFKKNYPTEIMKKIFLKKHKNLSKYFKLLIH
jgi:hypothetical protein